MEEFFKPGNRKFTAWVNQVWGIEFESVCQGLKIQGSPERSISRAVFKDTAGKRYLIEKFGSGKQVLRESVARAVYDLNRQGLTQALPYKPGSNGFFLQPYQTDGLKTGLKTGWFQISDFLDSTGIRQPEYLESAPMGDGFARFLTRLKETSGPLESPLNNTAFSIKRYIYRLFSQMKHHDRDTHDRFLPVLFFLEKEFMTVHDRLPLSFCHGDLHPLNVIWDKDRILAVIDWEFTGKKPDLYDAANLVGCAGIEDPNGFGMPMVMCFIQRVKENGIISDMGWRYFPEYVLALRFAWLSEWLRKKDIEMIDMEHAYMKILMKNMDPLRQVWEI